MQGAPRQQQAAPAAAGPQELEHAQRKSRGSPYGLGVSYDPKRGGKDYKARVFWRGKELTLGRYRTPHQARLAHDQAILHLASYREVQTNYPAGTHELTDTDIDRKMEAFIASMPPGSASVSRPNKRRATAANNSSPAVSCASDASEATAAAASEPCELAAMCPAEGGSSSTSAQQPVAAASSTRGRRTHPRRAAKKPPAQPPAQAGSQLDAAPMQQQQENLRLLQQLYQQQLVQQQQMAHGAHAGAAAAVLVPQPMAQVYTAAAPAPGEEQAWLQPLTDEELDDLQPLTDEELDDLLAVLLPLPVPVHTVDVCHLGLQGPPLADGALPAPLPSLPAHEPGSSGSPATAHHPSVWDMCGLAM